MINNVRSSNLTPNTLVQSKQIFQNRYFKIDNSVEG